MIMNDLIYLRRNLHAHPEIAGEERETAGILLEFLRQCHPDRILHHLGQTGFAVEYDSQQEGPVLMFRSELDGLLVEDKLDVTYISQNEGKGHKCGHDGHMAMLAGLAQHLHENPPKRGKVILLFQPAEETGEGAGWLLKDERFLEIQPDIVYAIHNMPGAPLGEVGVRKGNFASASEGMVIKLMGQTSHAGHPEEGRNPAYAIAEIIQEVKNMDQWYNFEDFVLGTIVQLSVGEISFGISPGYGELRLTLRAHKQDDLNRLKGVAQEKLAEIVQKHNLSHRISWHEAFTSTVNSEDAIEQVIKAAKANNMAHKEKDAPYRWSDDFGQLLSAYHGAMFTLGAGEDHPQLHSTDYDFPDELIEKGVAIYASLVQQHQEE
ncbi:MAG: amidohydrolase [Bacteroidia bacterium]